MTVLPLLLAASVAAQDFSVANALGAIRESAGGMGNIKGRAVGAPIPSQQDPFARALAANGIWGDGKAEDPPERVMGAQARAVTPLNLGFQALGPKGAKGRIKGPHPLGFADGTYEVVENSPFLVVLFMRTGYIDGRFTLKRDALTGQDTLGFAGRVMEDGNWSAPRSGMNSGVVSYDAATDTGAIRWLLNGQWKQDGYSRGRSGARAMRIELSGHAHDFFQD